MSVKARGFFLPPPGSRFTNRQLILMFLPVLLEQFLLNLSALSDTLLASGLSDAATAGVSHAFAIFNLANCLLYGFSTGGSVVTAQWHGCRNNAKASASARASVVFALAVSVLLCAVLLIRPANVITLLLGSIDPDVLEQAVTYLTYSALSLPCYAVVYAGAASFRAIGNTRMPMFACIVMLGTALFFKWLLTVRLGLGVMGTALANLIGAGLTAIVIVVYMLREKAAVSYRLQGEPFLNQDSLGRALQLCIPSGIENMSGALGLLFLQRIVAGCGIVDSAAHGIASRLQPYAYLPAYCWGFVALSVVGQYCGAGDSAMARSHTRHILKLCYLWMLPLNVLLIVFSSAVIHLFGGSEETLALAQKLFIFYCAFAMVLYTTMNALPQALRAAGDARLTMLVSVGSMFVVWVGIAALLNRFTDLGVLSVWIAMACDYLTRSVIYLVRYRGSRWLTHHILSK